MTHRTATSITSRLLSALAWSVMAVWGVAILWVAYVMVGTLCWGLGKWWTETVITTSWREWATFGAVFVVTGGVAGGLVALSIWALNRVSGGRLWA